MRDALRQVAKTLLLERAGKRRGFPGLKTGLRKTKGELETRLARASDSEKHRATLRHIIALERWGQRRLRVFLGEPLVQDENHAYKPPEGTAWEDLKRAFSETRSETLRLADALSARADLPEAVPHNQLGPLTAQGWLRYLTLHAALEAKRIR